MNITLFGGSFNPAHLGHALIIQDFLTSNIADQLWLMPDYQHSFAKCNHFAPVKDRLNMARLLEKEINLKNQIRTETCAIDHKMSGNTIEHITYLQKKYRNHTFSFLMGSDNLATFNKWPQWKTLLKLMQFWIYPRAGFETRPIEKGMKVFTAHNQTITNFSSSLVRNRIKSAHNVSLLLPKPILSYIKSHHLYI